MGLSMSVNVGTLVKRCTCQLRTEDFGFRVLELTRTIEGFQLDAGLR